MRAWRRDSLETSFTISEIVKEQPTIRTARLTLRPFHLNDAERVQQLAGDKRIADVTASIPHPYPDGAAQTWISTHSEAWKNRERVAYAITLTDTKLLVGCISLMNITNNAGELGYWIGVEYWGNGYCTEACKALIEHGFIDFGLQKISAKHIIRNPASGRILIKCGLVAVGAGSERMGYRKQIEDYIFYEIHRT